MNDDYTTELEKRIDADTQLIENLRCEVRRVNAENERLRAELSQLAEHWSRDGREEP